MNYNTQAQAYYRPAADTIFDQQVRAKKSIDILVGAEVWQAVGKLVLCALPVLLLINLCMGFYVNKIENSIKVESAARFELMDKHIALRANNARLTSKEYVYVAAAKKLSLQEPASGQVRKL